jgi:hypothetical protein
MPKQLKNPDPEGQDSLRYRDFIDGENYNLDSILFKKSELSTTVKDENHIAIHAHSGLRTRLVDG